MNKKISEYLSGVLALKHENKVRNKILIVLAAITVFVTVYVLIIPAITLETSPDCGLVEHVHSADCYDENGYLICGMVEHEHSDACVEEDVNTDEITGENTSEPSEAEEASEPGVIEIPETGETFVSVVSERLDEAMDTEQEINDTL